MSWWEDFFDANYAIVLEHMNDDKTLGEMADCIIRELKLVQGSFAMDQCCGFGSLSFALATRGVKMLGVDLCEAYIQKARNKQHESSLPCEFTVADATVFSADATCDAVINCRTSFGYSEDDAINLAMLKRAYDSLRPGGMFMLDTTNAPLVMAQFSPEHTYDVVTPEGNYKVTRHSAVDKARNMFTSRWEYALNDGARKRTYGESRIYFPEDLEKMLKQCGFHSIRFLGNFHADAYHALSPRCIAIACRG